MTLRLRKTQDKCQSRRDRGVLEGLEGREAAGFLFLKAAQFLVAKPQSTGELVVVSGAATRKVPSELG